MNLERFQYDSGKGLTLVMEKHGTHDQKTHGNWANSWTTGARTTPDDKWLIDNWGDKTTFTRNDPKGLLLFSIPNSLIDDPRYQGTIQLSLDTLEKLQDSYPLRTRVDFVAGDKLEGGFLGETFSASVDGVPAPSKIILAEGLLKPNAEKDILVHTITHEWGHAQDSRTADASRQHADKLVAAGVWNGDIPMTDYGFTNDREAYAEAFAIKFNGAHKGGVWSQNVPQTDKWEEVFKIFELDSLKKAKGERVSFLVKDTFDANNPPVLIENYTPPVQKHGTHDQKTHGNWATGGMGAGVADSILLRVRENGGLSVNMVDGSEPTSGYMVAKGAQFGSVVSADDFYDPIKGPKILADYMKKHKAQLGAGKNYLGLWHNKEDGKVYLDVSENIQDRERAISAGQKQDQISIWDVTNFAEIETGGTGNVEKTGSGRTTEEHRRNERFGNRSLRSENLGEVGKAYKVIRFEPGLIPIFKHLEGQHDQATHGNWATAGYTEEEKTRIAEWDKRGPALADLDALWSPVSEDELREMLLNDENVYPLVETAIANYVTAEIQDFDDREGRSPTQAEIDEITERVTEERILAYIENERDDYSEKIREEKGHSPEALQSSLEEVFNMEHTYTDYSGNERTITSKITYVGKGSDDDADPREIHVDGFVYDEDGNEVGKFERVLFKDEQTGVWAVENHWLEMAVGYRGVGFGKAFTQQTEDYYTNKGFGYIKVLAGLEDGARHWANAGFDYDPDEVQDSASKIKERFDIVIQNAPPDFFTQEDIDEFNSIYSRMANVDSQEVNDMKNPDFPLPAEFAMIGYSRRKDWKGQPTWLGKAGLYGLAIHYVKPLTAEGRSLLSGPIDRDGDGLIYDGTGRERPAPAPANN